jgi:hypothetical protein
MLNETLTQHALIRMAQRAIKDDDLEVIIKIGTEVEGGYLVRAKDSQALERSLKQLMQRVRRLNGKRVVVAEDKVITAYHAHRSKQRRLLRGAEQRAMKAGDCAL